MMVVYRTDKRGKRSMKINCGSELGASRDSEM